MSYYTTGLPLNNLLFKGLDITTAGDIAAAATVTFFVTILFEGLKVLKVYVDLSLAENPLARFQRRQSPEKGVNDDYSNASTTGDQNILLSSLQFPASVQQIQHRKIKLHIVSTLCMMVNFVVGYMLMLLVMSFNVWLTVAVVAGSGLGFFVFNAVNQVIQFRLKPYNPSQFDAAGDSHHELPPPPTHPSQARAGDL